MPQQQYGWCTAVGFVRQRFLVAVAMVRLVATLLPAFHRGTLPFAEICTTNSTRSCPYTSPYLDGAHVSCAATSLPSICTASAFHVWSILFILCAFDTRVSRMFVSNFVRHVDVVCTRKLELHSPPSVHCVSMVCFQWSIPRESCLWGSFGGALLHWMSVCHLDVNCVHEKRCWEDMIILSTLWSRDGDLM